LAWSPSKANIDTAAALGHTWPYNLWVANTGNDGLAGIHEALGLAPKPARGGGRSNAALDADPWLGLVGDAPRMRGAAGGLGR